MSTMDCLDIMSLESIKEQLGFSEQEIERKCGLLGLALGKNRAETLDNRRAANRAKRAHAGQTGAEQFR